MKNLIALIVALSLPGFAFADDSSDDEKTITIRKGALSQVCIEYQVVEGTEEVFGAPDADKQKAYGNWYQACEEWKKHVRELNKENQVIAAGCSRPKSSKDDANWVYRGTGLYKVKTRIREAAPPATPPK